MDVYTARDDVWSFTAHLARHASYMLSMCFLSDDVLTVGTSRADVILWDVLALASSTIVNDLGPGPGIVLGLAASAAHLACGASIRVRALGWTATDPSGGRPAISAPAAARPG